MPNSLTRDKPLIYLLHLLSCSSWSLVTLHSQMLLTVTVSTSSSLETVLMFSGDLTLVTRRVVSLKNSKTWLLACSNSFPANVLLWLMSLGTPGWREKLQLLNRSRKNSVQDTRKSLPNRHKIKLVKTKWELNVEEVVLTEASTTMKLSILALKVNRRENNKLLTWRP